MSSTSTPNDSPASAPILPLHNPAQAAHVVVPHTNGTIAAPGLGMKALLAKKMAKSDNPKFVSPTDNMVTPVTQKLNAAKQKRFAKGAKPAANLFSSQDRELHATDEQGESDAEISDTKSPAPVHADDNPFEC